MRPKKMPCKCGEHQLSRARGKHQWKRFTEYIGPGHSRNHTVTQCFEIERKNRSRLGRVHDTPDQTFRIVA